MGAAFFIMGLIAVVFAIDRPQMGQYVIAAGLCMLGSAICVAGDRIADALNIRTKQRQKEERKNEVSH